MKIWKTILIETVITHPKWSPFTRGYDLTPAEDLAHKTKFLEWAIETFKYEYDVQGLSKELNYLPEIINNFVIELYHRDFPQA